MATRTSTKLPVRYQALISNTLSYYQNHRRALPWRDQLSTDRSERFYQVLVSEIMLQQTQVTRVIPAYKAWMSKFPTLAHCAQSDLAEVLSLWQGLGYNRRAKYLHDVCKAVSRSDIPQHLDTLEVYKGVGPNTARAIAVYVDDLPQVFVETNIRTVVLHHIYPNRQKVSDVEIAEVMHRVLPATDNRSWYYALMDYGSYLKSENHGHLTRAQAHKKQSAFKGSRRELRGRVLRLLSAHKTLHILELKKDIPDVRLDEVIASLLRDELISRHGDTVEIG